MTFWEFVAWLAFGPFIGHLVWRWIMEGGELHQAHRRGPAEEERMIMLRYRNARGRVRTRSIRPAQLRRWLGRLRRQGFHATATLGREEVAWVWCDPKGWQYSVDDDAIEAASGPVRV